MGTWIFCYFPVRATLIAFQTNIRKAICFIFIYLFVHIYNKIFKKLTNDE